MSSGGALGRSGAISGRKDVVVDAGAEAGEQQPVAGQGVAVVPGDPGDEAVADQPGQVVAGLAHAVRAVQQAGDQAAEGLVRDAGDRKQHGGDGAGQGGSTAASPAVSARSRSLSGSDG